MSNRLRGHLIYLAVLCAVVAVQVVVAYLRPSEMAQQIGVLEDRGYIDGFHPREFSEFYDTGYRWSKPGATLSLPGLGSRGRFRLELDTFGGPDELLGRRVDVLVNGEPAGFFVTAPDWRKETIEFGTGWWGDARIELRVPEGSAPGDSRPLGISLRSFRAGVLEPGPPALSQILAGVLLAGSLYLLLALLGFNRAVCGAVSAVAGLLFSLGLTNERLVAATWSYGLVFSALGALLLVACARWFIFLDGTRAIGWREAGVRRALLAILAVGFILRLGGTTYPQAYVIDTRQHLEDVGKVLTGQLDELWTPLASALHNSRAAADLIIPYPPLYAMAVAPFAALPLPWPQGRTLQGFSVLLDAAAILLLFALGRRARLSTGAALLACVLYAIAPVMLQAFSWGVGPALFGSFAMLLLLVLWTLLPPGRRSMAALAAAAALALMAYAFNAVFVPLMMLGVLLVVLPRAPSPALRLLLAMALGLMLDFASFYWQYVGPALETTLPALLGSRDGGSGLRRNDADAWTLLDLIAREWPLPLSVAVLTGAALAFLPGARRSAGDPGRVLLPALVLGGLLVFATFTWIEQIIYLWHKHVWFAAPYLALAGGLALAGWARRGLAGRLFVATGLAATAFAALWFYRGLILFGSPLFP